MIDRANEQAVAAPIRWPIGDVLNKAKSALAGIADVLTVYAEAWGAALLYEEPGSPTPSWSASACLAPSFTGTSLRL